MRVQDSKLALRATWLATRALALVSPRLAGPLAARLWFTPWRVPVSERAAARQAEWLSGTDRLTFSSDDGRVAAYGAGAGPAVVLVHGWGERGASLGAFVRPLVAEGYRVVGVDLPGHGASEGGQSDGFRLAAAIAGVCEQVGDVRAIVAHSMGATTSLYAVSQGLEVDALALIAPSPRLDHAFETFGKMAKLTPAALSGLKGTIERRYGPGVWQAFSAHTVAPEVHVPALIVHDRDDDQVAWDDVRVLHDVWPGSRLVTTKGLGHARILRDPDVIETVTSFLREVAPVAATAGA